MYKGHQESLPTPLFPSSNPTPVSPSPLDPSVDKKKRLLLFLGAAVAIILLFSLLFFMKKSSESSDTPADIDEDYESSIETLFEPDDETDSSDFLGYDEDISDDYGIDDESEDPPSADDDSSDEDFEELFNET